MISTLAFAAIVLLWFGKIFIIAMTGITAPLTPMIMLLMSFLLAAAIGHRIHRWLS